MTSTTPNRNRSEYAHVSGIPEWMLIQSLRYALGRFQTGAERRTFEELMPLISVLSENTLAIMEKSTLDEMLTSTRQRNISDWTNISAFAQMLSEELLEIEAEQCA
jgi:Holliday junction resolvasome RuvABC DNA-binding subunit